MEKILLFIPMYNCEKQIVRVLKQLTNEICSYITEVIIVNNRSTDPGESVVQSYLSENPLPIKASLLRNDDNYGLGGSHKVAFQYAINHGFDYVIVLHGDDQGRINDLLPLIKSGEYKKHDCCLGARFMKGAQLLGYSKLRIMGNYGFNWLFSIATRKSIKDLGAGLNMYKVSILKSKYFMRYPDTLYFNDLMILASSYYGHDMYFYPITWREEDQMSNNKLWSFSFALLKMLWNYIRNKRDYVEQDMRSKKIDNYTSQIIYTNQHV